MKVRKKQITATTVELTDFSQSATVDNNKCK